jgi:protease I
MAKVLIVIGDGFEDSEFSVPCGRLKSAGHQVTLTGGDTGATVHGKRGKVTAKIERGATNVDVDDYDAMLIPGGHAPDRLRLDEAVVALVRDFMDTGKPLAVICHGPQLLIEAGRVEGRTLTSWPSVRTDLVNAGATWLDQEVVEDGNLISSRSPDDLDAFCAALLHTLNSRAKTENTVVQPGGAP